MEMVRRWNKTVPNADIVRCIQYIIQSNELVGQRVLNIQRHHWTVHAGPSIGCHRDVPSGSKITAHTLAGDTAPVYYHAHAWIKTMRCIVLCNSCRTGTLAERLWSAGKWLNCTPFPWQWNGTKMPCTRLYSRFGDQVLQVVALCCGL